MTEQSDFSQPRNDERAQKVVRVLEQFHRELTQRAGDDHAAEVVLDKKRLDGRIIKQEPERFIEDRLVEPIMSVLGHDIRFRPKGFDGLEGRIPDFTVLNLDAENFGEVKTPGTIRKARKESFEYQEMATERPLVGFSTDGFTWILHTAAEGESPTYTSHETIYQVLRKVRIEQAHEKAKRRNRPEMRERAYKFTSQFGKESVQARLPESR